MKAIKSFINWVACLFKDERGSASSKRFIGIISGLSLCGALFINLYTEHPVDPFLINAVAALAFGSLGLASIDKIWAKRPGAEKKNVEQINS